MSEASQWITEDVELPQAVLDAHADGRLVFFVGAGASVDDPSGLPLFGELARQLAALARVPYDDKVAIDYFLGAMPNNFDTHTHARDIIAREDSAPNATHHALLRLATAIGPMRVVTTNFDDHLASAASTEDIAVPDKWIGPALPLGDCFEGLVHLHGSVLRDPNELVLTDRDFGRAYLTTAWATRFLMAMFQKFTVVFVGYSHDDPVMRYLALGLPSESFPRFAFTGDRRAADPEWTRLGVTPVSYPVIGDDHGALQRALEAWDTRARMGTLDHQGRVRELVAAGPVLTPVDRDYLRGRLQTADGARDFGLATADVSDPMKIEWLRWVEDLPEFKILFGASEVPDASAVLGDWFCRTFIASPDLHGAALQTVERLGQSMTGMLFQSASWMADQLAKNDPVAGERWRAVLATSVHGRTAPLSTELLLPFLPQAEARSAAVLRSALRPFLVLKQRWFIEDSEAPTAVPDAEVAWRSDQYALTQHVLHAVQSAAPGDLRLGGALEEALSSAYDLLDAYHGERDSDTLSHRRSAIETHEQDGMRDTLDSIIDGLRDFGVKARESRDDLPERWWALDRSLFRRLALHLVATDPSRAPDEKLLWLLDRVGLYEYHLKHESYQVLATAIAGASDTLRRRILAAVDVGPDYPDDIEDRDRHLAYARYNLLVWLTRSDPNWEAAVAALDKVQRENPSFDAREHPDFDMWMTGGIWGGKLPMEPEDFIQSLENDLGAALDDLLSRDYSERNFGDPTWSDAITLVEKAVGTRPDLGVVLWNEVASREDMETRGDLLRAIVDGWSKADLGDSALAAIHLVRSLVPDDASARAIGRFLLEQIQASIDSDETPALAAMRDLARALWSEQGERFTHREDSDPLSVAPLYLNSWPGFLAQYWMNEVDRRWRHHRDDWSGLSQEEDEALTGLLGGTRAVLDAVQPAVANYLHFLFAADEDFTIEHVLPLFRDDQTATFAWYPYLHHPRYSDRLLEAGLLESTILEWNRLDALGERGLQQIFFALVASILSDAQITAEAEQDLLSQSVLAGDGAHAVEFAEGVYRFLGEDRVDGAGVWTRWLREHLTDRLNGVPRTAEPAELAQWAHTVPRLGSAVPEAIALFQGRGIGLEDGYFNPDISDAVLTAHGPELVVHFAERVRNTHSANGMVGYRVRKLIENVRAVVGEAIAQPLVNAAAECGFIGEGSP